MNLKQAQYMRTIAACGSITAAAKKLFVSQPSLSQMLHQIEEDLGVILFDRRVSPFRITYAGEKYLKAADAVIAANQQLENELNEIKHETSGRLRLVTLMPRRRRPEVSCLISLSSFSSC